MVQNEFQANIEELQNLLLRSDQFQETIAQYLNEIPEPSTNRAKALWLLSMLVHEHAAGMRLLFEHQLPATALSTMRILYDALVRQLWVGYCAEELHLEKLMQSVTPESLQQSMQLPSTHEMLRVLEASGPKGLHRILMEFKEYSSKPLNSMIHSGMYAISVVNQGVLVPIFLAMIKQSNNLLHMSALQLTEHAQLGELMQRIHATSDTYKDCFQWAE